ncbi:MAG: hypothetical protein MUF16_04200 [Burkholderiaceae bacterium]|nr:hypothetical protein [Burkholderiaceae bacterium]
MNVALAGCVTTMALDRAVVGHDTTTAYSVSKQLLIHIAWAHHNQPMLFTAISGTASRGPCCRICNSCASA